MNLPRVPGLTPQQVHDFLERDGARLARHMSTAERLNLGWDVFLSVAVRQTDRAKIQSIAEFGGLA